MSDCRCLGRGWQVDFGSLGTLCNLCQVPTEYGLEKQWLAARGWRCPVCKAPPQEVKQFVVHHDHFPDALWPLCVGHSDPALRELIDTLQTFPPTKLCGACNSLDSIAKTEMRKLPRWFSLSPTDMRRVRLPDGNVDLEQVAAIWEEKRTGVIARSCKELWLAGVAKEDIRTALAEYKTASAVRSEKRRTLAAKIAGLAHADRQFANLMRVPGNDVQLLTILYAASWDHASIEAFVHFYRRKNGDPMLENRPPEFGPQQFKTWLMMQARGERRQADEYQRKCRFWRTGDKATAS